MGWQSELLKRNSESLNRINQPRTAFHDDQDGFVKIPNIRHTWSYGWQFALRTSAFASWSGQYLKALFQKIFREIECGNYINSSTLKLYSQKFRESNGFTIAYIRNLISRKIMLKDDISFFQHSAYLPKICWILMLKFSLFSKAV